MKKSLLAVGLFLTPALAFAASNGSLGNLNNIVVSLGKIVGALIPIAFGIAVVAFFWGLARYIFAAGSEESKAEGRRIMIGGIIALFIMASIWGIIYFIRDALGVGNDTTIQAPSIQ